MGEVGECVHYINFVAATDTEILKQLFWLNILRFALQAKQRGSFPTLKIPSRKHSTKIKLI